MLQGMCTVTVASGEMLPRKSNSKSGPVVLDHCGGCDCGCTAASPPFALSTALVTVVATLDGFIGMARPLLLHIPVQKSIKRVNCCKIPRCNVLEMGS